MDGLARRTDSVLMIYLCTTSALILWFRDSVAGWTWLVPLHVGAACAIYALRRIRAPLPGLAQFFRDWYPAIAFPILYREVEHLAASFGNWSLTESLQAREISLFAGHPSLYLSERYPYVALSETLHLCYFSYVLLIPVVGGLWYFRGSRDAFRELLFLASLTFAASYTFYVLFPVDSPYYVFDRLGPPLSGHVFYELVHWMAAGGGARGGAFPSSHVSISTVVLLSIGKWSPRWLYWYTPLYTGLVAATVYGRFHYALDVFAGWALAVALVGAYRLDAGRRPAPSAL